MLQASVPNVSAVFPDVCCKCIYLNVAYVSHICCKCFVYMLHMFYLVSECFQVFLQVFHMHISSVSFAFRCMLQVLHQNVSKSTPLHKS
jgi:hypothetical protein